MLINYLIINLFSQKIEKYVNNHSKYQQILLNFTKFY